MEIQTILENLDNYDTDLIQSDFDNNNFDLDNWREEIQRYHKPVIVAQSWLNGQRKQASEQFLSYGLSAHDLQDHMTDQEIINLLSKL